MRPSDPSSLAVLTDKLVRSVSASIWEASAGLDGAIGNERRQMELVDAVRTRLASSHPELIVREIATKKRAAGRSVGKRSNKPMRKWRPTRPRLALAAVKLLETDEVVVQAPEKQREDCLMQFKIFANALTRQLQDSVDASG